MEPHFPLFHSALIIWPPVNFFNAPAGNTEQGHRSGTFIKTNQQMGACRYLITGCK